MSLGLTNTKIVNYGRLSFRAKKDLRPRIQMKLSATSKMSRGTNRKQTKFLIILACTNLSVCLHFLHIQKSNKSRLIKLYSTSFHAGGLPLDQSSPNGFLESFSFTHAVLCSLLRLSFNYKSRKRQHPRLMIKNRIQTFNSSLLFSEIQAFFN